MSEQEMRREAAKLIDPVEAIRQMDERLRSLRAPFPKEAIDKLPKPFKKDAPKGKCLPRSEGGNAPDDQDYHCGQWHGLPAFHLDYVGHAYVTERLLDVDPLWTWEPMSLDEKGLPHLIVTPQGDPVAMWIKMTVCGVTRIGVGTVDPGCKDPEKQLISDAIRNAAMRFGVAIDMWMKSGEDDVVQDVRSAQAGVPGGALTRPGLVGPGERTPGVLDTPKAPDATVFPMGGKNPRHVFDIPITIAASYQEFRGETLGGRGKYKDSTWQEMIEGDHERVDYLENYLVEKASEAWQTMPQGEKERGKSVLPVYQKVLLTYQELLDRREAPSTVE